MVFFSIKFKSVIYYKKYFLSGGGENGFLLGQMFDGAAAT